MQLTSSGLHHKHHLTRVGCHSALSEKAANFLNKGRTVGFSTTITRYAAAGSYLFIIDLFIHYLFTHLLIPLGTYLFIFLFIWLFIYSFLCVFIYSFTYLFI
jgi:hypothetical protein